MSNRLQIVSSGLLVANVSVEWGVSCCASEILTIAEGNMFSLWVLEALCETEVNDVDIILSGLGSSNQEVVGLDVTVDDALFMHFLDALDL